MKLSHLSLENFRNYSNLELDFPKSLNIFLGENAQGKTNILEAIYTLAMSKSHRTHNEKELIKWDCDFAKVSGLIEKEHSRLPLEVLLTKKGRKTKVNYLEQKKLSAYIGHLNVILFAPEDLALVKGAPSVRRRFLDMELGQISPVYLYELVRFNQLLKQRNAYLKQEKIDPVLLSVLTDEFVKSGTEVIFQRLLFIEKLEGFMAKIQEEITSGKEAVTLSYDSYLPVKEKNKEVISGLFKEALEEKKAQELFRKTTLIGPHRDDLLFFINDINVQAFGSQGQQRTTALCVKLAEIDLMKEEIGEYPILLLDDVMSELDDNRQLHLLSAIEGKVQTFLTTTTLTHLQNNLTVTPDIFYVKKGSIERQGEQA